MSYLLSNTCEDCYSWNTTRANRFWEVKSGVKFWMNVKNWVWSKYFFSFHANLFTDKQSDLFLCTTSWNWLQNNFLAFFHSNTFPTFIHWLNYLFSYLLSVTCEGCINTNEICYFRTNVNNCVWSKYFFSSHFSSFIDKLFKFFLCPTSWNWFKNYFWAVLHSLFECLISFDEQLVWT